MPTGPASTEANKQAIQRLYDETDAGDYGFVDALIGEGDDVLVWGTLSVPTDMIALMTQIGAISGPPSARG